MESSLSQKESVERETNSEKQTESQFLSDDGLQRAYRKSLNLKVDLKSIKSIKESDNV